MKNLVREIIGYIAVSLAVLVSACGGEQAKAPEPATAMSAPASAPLVAPVQPPAPQPYAYLWEQALQPRPFPRRLKSEAGAAAMPADEAAPPAAEPQAQVPAALSAAAAPNTPDDAARGAPQGLDLPALAPYLDGIASWYGPNFHGKPTANGEVYNQFGLTAAHPALPIGTKVEVENLENGRKVWVRINDRGPYAKGRVLDLSKIAAEHLGMIENGTAHVHITVLQWPTTVNANFGLKAYQQYVVQAAAYPDVDAAEILRERLQAQFPQVPVMMDLAANGFFAVVAGPFDDESEARHLSRQMQRKGMTTLVRRYRN
jgi:rare lipoprotein A